MELTPFHLQVVGVIVIIAMALGFVFWSARAVLGIHRGHPVYVLPDPDPDHDDVDGDGGDQADT